MPPPNRSQEQPPEFHVSVVSPQESGVHQKIGHQRRRGNAAGGPGISSGTSGVRPRLDDDDLE
jgi:hypothetical protein